MRGCQCELDIEKVSRRMSVRMLMRGCQCENDIEKVSMRRSVSGC